MRVTSSVRPHGLKRGVSTKAWHKAIGLPEYAGLHETCGRIELNADGPKDHAVLKLLNDALTGHREVKIYNAAGAEVAVWNWDDGKTD